MARSEFTADNEPEQENTKGQTYAPVVSDYPIPLFPDFAKDNRHVIQKILVHKMTAPGDGFKGEIPPTSTLSYIGRVFGNGIYELHAVSGEGKVLRRAQNVKVDLPPEPQPLVNPRAHQPAREADLALLHFQRDQHEKDAERVATFARESNEQNRQMTERHLTMVERTTEAQMARDREFFASQAQMQRDFFANLMAFQQQSHQQTITLMETSYQRMLQQNDPMTLIALFQQGLQMGQGLGQDDSNPLVSVMDRGVQGLEKLRQLMILKNPPAPRKLPSGTRPQAAPNQAPTLPNLTPEAAAKIAKIKAKVEQKGYDWESALDQMEKLVDLQSPAVEESLDDVDEQGADESTEGTSGDT